MSQRRSLLGDVSWFQVLAGVLAAVTAAWIASSLGVAGTLIGTAVASFVATISAALYGRTLDKGKTLLVQTTSGTVIEERVRDGEIGGAFDRAAEVDGSPVERAEIVETTSRRLHWKTIIGTTIVVLLLSLAAISTFEVVAGKSLDGSSGTTIGDTFGGSSKKAPTEPTESKDPDKTPATPEPTATPTPRPTRTTAPQPAPTATATTPVPTQPTPEATESTPAPAADEPAE